MRLLLLSMRGCGRGCLSAALLVCAEVGCGSGWVGRLIEIKKKFELHTREEELCHTKPSVEVESGSFVGSTRRQTGLATSRKSQKLAMARKSRVSSAG